MEQSQEPKQPRINPADVKDPKLRNALARVQQTENRVNNLEPEVQRTQIIGAQKEAKRKRELERIQAKLSELYPEGQEYDSILQGEMKQAALRMAEYRVRAEIKVEALEKELAQKNEHIQSLEDQLQRARDEIQSLKLGGGAPVNVRSIGGASFINRQTEVTAGVNSSIGRATGPSAPDFGDSINQRVPLAGPSVGSTIARVGQLGPQEAEDEEEAFWY